MEPITEFLNSEKSLYLFTGIIGVASFIVGLLFLFFSNHKSFATTMLVIGLVEMVVMFPTYKKYQTKADSKISFYENHKDNFVALETENIKKDLRSFLTLTLIYSTLIIILAFAVSKLSHNSILFGIFTALILHLAFAITIDVFGEKYTKKYLEEISLVKG